MFRTWLNDQEKKDESLKGWAIGAGLGAAALGGLNFYGNNTPATSASNVISSADGEHITGWNDEIGYFVVINSANGMIFRTNNGDFKKVKSNFTDSGFKLVKVSK